MKRTVYHITKATQNLTEQPDYLFPFLNSHVVDMHSKKYIKYKSIHGICNLTNLHTIVPHQGTPYQFIFFGRSNVGKSTLLNNLMQSSVAAVSKRPGKTKQLLFCELQTPTKAYLIDAPGYGFATGVSKRQIGQWGKLISTYFLKTKQNHMNQQILCLLDINHGLKETDALIFNMLKSMERQFQIVFTKCDKMDNKSLQEGLELAKKIQTQYSSMNFYVHFTSNFTMRGIDQLRNHLMFQSISNQIK